MSTSRQLLAQAKIAALTTQNRALRLQLAASVQELRRAAASLRIAADVLERRTKKDAA